MREKGTHPLSMKRVEEEKNPTLRSTMGIEGTDREIEGREGTLCGGQSREGIYTRGVKVTAPTVSVARLLMRSRDTSRFIPVSSLVCYSCWFKSPLLQSPFANAMVHRTIVVPRSFPVPRMHARARARVSSLTTT